VPRSDLLRRPVATCLAFLGLAALYLLGATILGTWRWDGFSPEPYRYVSPPPGHQNPGPPASAKGSVVFVNGQSRQVQFYTSDLQAQILIPAGAFPPDASASDVTVTIVPQAPPHLSGLAAVGNAYVITATYSSGAAVPEPWLKPAMIYLRFPSGPVPSSLYQLVNGQPVKLTSTVDTPTLTAQGASDRGGTFLAAGTPATQPSGQPARTPGRIAAIVVASGGVVLVLLGLLLLTRTGRQPGSGERRRRRR
jgi:hypothetical protein